jgi:hypothetical protein
MSEDVVNHPKHYTFSKYEVLDVITKNKLIFAEGNVIKYLARSPFKNRELEDLKKAHFYLNYLLDNNLVELNNNKYGITNFSMDVLDDWKKSIDSDTINIIRLVFFKFYEKARDELYNLIIKKEMESVRRGE